MRLVTGVVVFATSPDTSECTGSQDSSQYQYSEEAAEKVKTARTPPSTSTVRKQPRR